MERSEKSITLRLYGALQHAVGSKAVALSGDDVLLGDLLRGFVSTRSERVSDMIFDKQGDVWRSVILLVNDAPASHGMQTPLRAGDTVSLLLPVAGG
jgi:molybdopterin converting factor small subunit